MELVQYNFKFIELGTCIMYTGAILEPITWPMVKRQMKIKKYLFLKIKEKKKKKIMFRSTC